MRIWSPRGSHTITCKRLPICPTVTYRTSPRRGLDEVLLPDQLKSFASLKSTLCLAMLLYRFAPSHSYCTTVSYIMTCYRINSRE